MVKSKVEFFLVDADYIITGNGVTQVRLFGRDAKGKTVVAICENFLPYFYMLPKHSPKQLIEQLEGISLGGKGFEKLEVVEKLYNGKTVEAVKGSVRAPPEVPIFRELVRKCGELEEKLETDVPFVKKFMIENGFSPLGKLLAEGDEIAGSGLKADVVIAAEKIKALDGELPELKVLAFDIEVHCPKGAPRPRHDPITMISLAGSGLKKVLTWQRDKNSKAPDYVEVLGDEAAVIRRFLEIVEEYDPDVIVGYNSDAFDFPYLRDRARVHQIRLVLGRDGNEVGFVRRGPSSAAATFGRLLLDVFPFIDNIVSRGMKAESLDLNTVAQELLGTGKTGLGYEDMVKKWQDGRLVELYEYSLKDSALVEMLSGKLLPMAYEFAKLTRNPIFDAIRMTSGQIVEWVLFSRAYGMNIMAPNHPLREDVISRRSVTYVGGYVRQPEIGLHDNIAVLDYRSLYPSIIISHNIDPSTIDCDCCSPSKEGAQYFCSKKKGFIPTVLREVLTKRLELKSLLKKAGKGTLEYRILDARQQALKQVANSFYGYMGFSGARWYCLKCAEAVTALGRMYIQQTIDAAEKEGFRVLYADTDSCFISTPGQEGIDKKAWNFLEQVNRGLPETMELELQGIYRRGVFVTKKRYAMLAGDGSMVVKGLERVRRDWAPIAKDTQEAVLRALLEKADPKEAARIVRDAVKRLRERRVSIGDVTILTQLTKDPDRYELTAPHVEAAKKMIAKGREARAGVLIRFIVKKGRGSISERSYPAEDVTLSEYDPEYYINNQVLPAALRIMEALGFKEAEELKSEQKKLGEFS